MLSRDAEAIHWAGRLIQRTENVARFMSASLLIALDHPPGSQEPWEPLVAATGSDLLFRECYSHSSKENAISFFGLEKKNPNSIYICLEGARENARSVRGSLPSELWEAINMLWLELNQADLEQYSQTDPSSFFSKILRGVNTISGIAETTFARGEEWHFLQLGRMIERADQTTRLLDVKTFFTSPHPGVVNEESLWLALLQSAGGYEMYRKRYGGLHPDSVIAFLLLDREFPQAVLYCLRKADFALRAITGTKEGTFRIAPEQLLSRLRYQLSFQSVPEIHHRGLHLYLDDIQIQILKIGQSLYESFFARQVLIQESLLQSQQ